MHTGTLKVLLIVATFTAAALAGPERGSDRSAAADGVLLL